MPLCFEHFVFIVAFFRSDVSSRVQVGTHLGSQKVTVCELRLSTVFGKIQEAAGSRIIIMFISTGHQQESVD